METKKTELTEEIKKQVSHWRHSIISEFIKFFVAYFRRRIRISSNHIWSKTSQNFLIRRKLNFMKKKSNYWTNYPTLAAVRCTFPSAFSRMKYHTRKVLSLIRICWAEESVKGILISIGKLLTTNQLKKILNLIDFFQARQEQSTAWPKNKFWNSIFRCRHSGSN